MLEWQKFDKYDPPAEGIYWIKFKTAGIDIMQTGLVKIGLFSEVGFIKELVDHVTFSPTFVEGSSLVTHYAHFHLPKTN